MREKEADVVVDSLSDAYAGHLQYIVYLEVYFRIRIRII